MIEALLAAREVAVLLVDLFRPQNGVRGLNQVLMGPPGL